VHEFAAAQETAVSVGPHLTDGRVSRRQVLPFQSIAAAICGPVEPTAIQKRRDTHETPVSALPRAAPSGVGRTAQVEPFQTSTRPRELRLEKMPSRLCRPCVCVEPTATQNVAEGQDSEARVGLVPAAGVGRTVHAEPSQRSAKVAMGPTSSVWMWLKPKSEVPTAMHSVGNAHDTLATAAFEGPLGPGIVCAAQVAADAEAGRPTLSRPQTTAARRTHLPIPIPIRMVRSAHPT
jgi:hypothetical protein